MSMQPMSRAATRAVERGTLVFRRTQTVVGGHSANGMMREQGSRIGELRIDGHLNKISGADAPGGNTRTHPEHDG